MKIEKQNPRPVMIAAITASFLMLVSTVAYRVLTARLEAPVNTTLISPSALEQLPLQIGGWIGQEVPVDEAIVRATGTEAHINRRYSRQNTSEYILLYVAYGVRPRDLMPHRPEVCYTGAGWTLIDKRSVELPLSDGVNLPCTALQFSRGILDAKKTLVLDYYIVNGQYCRDVSLLRSKAWRGSGTVRYVVQVQIAISVTANLAADSAVKIVYDFAAESASSISKLFENAEDNQNSNKDSFNADPMFRGAGSG